MAIPVTQHSLDPLLESLTTSFTCYVFIFCHTGSNLADSSSRSIAGSIPACYTLVGSGGSSSRSGACGNGCVGGGIGTAATASGTVMHSGSEGQASTSYLPANQNSAVEEWDALGACMFIAQDMEEALDAVVRVRDRRAGF